MDPLTPRPTMDPLTLPPELVLEIISHLPLASLPALRRASRAWAALIAANEDAVFRLQAEALGVLPPCNTVDPRHPAWTQICQCTVAERVMRTHKICTVHHYSFGTDFHPWRIKIDRDHQLLFATTTDLPEDYLSKPGVPDPDPSGLVVVDLKSKNIIQRIPEVKQYAHIEYDAGYLVTTGLRDTMTIYRTPWAVPPSHPPEQDTPMPDQDPPPLAPHGQISSPGFRALRMHGTHLVTASETLIEIFDIPECRMVQRIQIPARQVSMIMYVEMDDEYVFLCALGYELPPPALLADLAHPEPILYVHHRQTGPFVVPLTPDPPFPRIAAQMAADPQAVLQDPRLRVRVEGGKPCVLPEVAGFEVARRVGGRDVPAPFRPDVPVACHYGTTDLVVLCRNGSTLLVPAYKSTFRLPRAERHRRIYALSLPAGPEYWNLAVEGDTAYITSYQDRLFNPSAALLTLDLPTVRPSPSAALAIRSLDIPLPNQLATTHSLQATTHGIYMPVRIVASRAADGAWLPPGYRRDVRGRTDVLCLRYSRH